MNKDLKFDYVSNITPAEFDDDVEVVINTEDDEIEAIMEETDWLEFEKPRFKNVRAKLGLILELIQHTDQILPNQEPPRTKYEMNGGIKKAIQRGAMLQEVEVFNLYFKFRSHLHGDGIALMYKSPSMNKECIILLPDNTELRIEKEKILYKNEAFQLVIKELMSPDSQSFLLENLNMLNLHERCAQSLQHEFGHVLNVREFETLDIMPYNAEAMYTWFGDFGYLDNVDKRYPVFGGISVWDKLHVMKESLVEDYRISLNIRTDRGKFILPNKFGFSGDFQNSEFLLEGVELMKRMLKGQLQVNARRPASSSDYDTIKAFHEVQQRRISSNWVAGTPSMTKDVISRDLEELRRSPYNQVAATK
ncbi:MULTISPECIES: hypothetical protein [unclassified Paenibacillus]|uniref:hypothetical protein n=1 Tax=unclassified Paenibacillus TaxID=185978 RepID=UPI0004224787|nr:MULTISPECIES: hypothetical protein [unclassified Paenibacillus]KGP81939.1 hypothetical protein P364_0114030 [Paenibacillus sp. MAEPY2]KGP86025.1 hypothetical protein P363_0119505 [Paenibacillus sp. MAEPY1]